MYQYPDYLMHYGIPGMKWGVRKQRTYDTSTAYGRMKTAKQQYKSDKKAYNKSFNKAYYHNHAYSLSKKKRQASEKRWEDVSNKVDTLNSSKKAYKSAKKAYKQERKRSYERGKRLDKDLRDTKQIRWNEDYNNRLLKSMSKRDYEDLKYFQKESDRRATAATLALAVGGISAALLVDKYR